ncbi:MAG: T9SS type A sorting domain-containing protein [Chitinophagales bacterium]
MKNFILLCVACGFATLLRAQQPGTLDLSFDLDGKVTSDFTSNAELAYTMKILNNGRVLVAGQAKPGANFDVVLVAYTPSGKVDSTFGVNGKTFTDLGNNELAMDMLLQPDGKILLIGNTTTANNSNGKWMVSRYSSSGFPDSSFGTNGSVTLDFNPAMVERANAGALQADGKLLVIGYSAMQGYNTTLARFTTTGSLDSTFGINGVLVYSLGPFEDYGADIEIQNDGKYVVGGYRMYGGGYNFALARLYPGGTTDSTFGINGFVETDFGFNDDDAISAIYLHGNKITAVGSSGYNGDTDPAIARYSSNGIPDSSFGINGKLTTPVGAGYGHLTSAVIQPDGKLLTTGYARNTLNDDFILLRYNADGTLDNGFNSTGLVTTAFFSSEDQAHSIQLQPDGKAVVAGATFNGASSDIALARYYTGIAVVACNADTTTITQSICNGQGFAFNGQQVVAAGIYYDTLTNAGGCDSLVILHLAVNNSTAAITVNGDTAVCEGDSIMLSASTANSYLWSTGETSAGIYVYQSGIYTVTITDGNNCTASVVPVAIEVYPLPAKPAVSQSGDTLYSSTAVHYQWYFEGGPLLDDTLQKTAPTSNGEYTVVVTDSNGCSNTSNSFMVSGLALPLLESATFTLSPNPAHETVTVSSFNGPITKAELLDYTGKLVRQQNHTINQPYTFDVNDLPAGTYYVKVVINERPYAVPFIKQ